MQQKRRPYSALVSTSRSQRRSNSVIITSPHIDTWRKAEEFQSQHLNESCDFYKTHRETRPTTSKTHRFLENSEQTNRHHSLTQSLKTYRLSHHEAYTGIRSDVIKTFAPADNKLYKEIKELNGSLSIEHARALEKMLQKYCIKSKYNKNSLWALPINAEHITKHYVRNKSTSRQKEEVKKLIKEDIDEVSGQVDTRTDPHRKENRPFFHINGGSIRKFEGRLSSARRRARIHPIVEVFNEKSDEVIQKYISGEDLKRTEIFDGYPTERIDEEEVRHERLQNATQLKELKHSINELRTRRKEAPRKPFTDSLC